MSTLVAQTISNGTVSTSTANVINGAKAWVNFNGTGTVAIRASYNVSSITDNGTGDYTVNFTNALTDANYSFVASSSISNSGPTWAQVIVASKTVGGNAVVAPTTTALRIVTQGNGGSAGAMDCEYICVSCFR